MMALSCRESVVIIGSTYAGSFSTKSKGQGKLLSVICLSTNYSVGTINPVRCTGQIQKLSTDTKVQVFKNTDEPCCPQPTHLPRGCSPSKFNQCYMSTQGGTVDIT